MSVRPGFGVVVLTQGRRRAELALGLQSILAQKDVDLDIVVVGNGWVPEGLPEGVRGVSLTDNAGIPGGRNAGVKYVKGETLFFLDDDARLRDDDTLVRMAALFAAEPDLGVVQPRVLDPDGIPTPRRWTPRLRVGDPARSSDVAALWEGAVAVRRSVFEQVGGWPDEFWFMHEGIDLAWAVWDAGARVHYAGDVIALHPAAPKRRPPRLDLLSMRNRVFLARRRLPLPIAAVYVTVWVVLTLARVRTKSMLLDALRGLVAGFRQDAGPRRPISWRTVWRMTRAGRPPVI